MELAAAIGVTILQQELLGTVLDEAGVSRLVDQVLLPLILGVPTS
ncbi:hypothetical protein C5F59_038640 [Streptomyces sp. QL37]|nr:hypothetical protein [Streptomyces sp. QL37]